MIPVSAGNSAEIFPPIHPSPRRGSRVRRPAPGRHGSGPARPQAPPPTPPYGERLSEPVHARFANLWKRHPHG